MPYIKDKEDRAELDRILRKHWPILRADGHLNYFLFALCRRHETPSYNNYKNFIGELNQCATEIERRLLAPYEDEAIQRNGDVD